MGDPIPFLMRVANSNPNSKFAAFVIECAVERENPHTEFTYLETVESREALEAETDSHSPPFYVLWGVYAGSPHVKYGGARELGRFDHLADAKELLFELNGVIEEDEDVE